MNICGRNVKKASKELNIPNKNIIVLHDCCETKLGVVKLNQGEKSFKGHNGLRSIHNDLQKSFEFSRIAIGIGKPALKESGVLADFVLSPFTQLDYQEMERLNTL